MDAACEVRLINAIGQTTEEPLKAGGQTPAFLTLDLQRIVATGLAAREHEQSEGCNKKLAHPLAIADLSARI